MNNLTENEAKEIIQNKEFYSQELVQNAMETLFPIIVYDLLMYGEIKNG